MNTIKLLLITGAMLLFSCGSVLADADQSKARATFAVHCYDVGAHAFKDVPGVLEVESGWQWTKEVNRVVYDPQVITLEQLQEHLRKSGTYVETLEATVVPAKP